MSDTIQADIDHMRASADALDDPDDIENRAILDWMKHHIAFRYHAHKYVLTTEPLPLRWRDRAVSVPTAATAVAILTPIKQNHTALAGLRAAVERMVPNMCFDTDGAIALLADALVNKRATLFIDAKKPPIAGKTDPSVYTALNGTNGTAVDFGYLSKWEGDQYLRGYVPFIKGVTAGASGMTVATGFDVGQISELELSKLALRPETGPKLAPFAGIRFKGKTRAQVAAAVVKRGPVPVLTKQEADTADLVVHGKHLTAAILAWNARRKPGVPEFQALPVPWQTVLFSRTFHQGTGMPDTGVAQPFYTAATTGKWADAVTALQNYAVTAAWYKTRVSQEAAFLRTAMPPPVTAPAAPGSGSSAAPAVPPRP